MTLTEKFADLSFRQTTSQSTQPCSVIFTAFHISGRIGKECGHPVVLPKQTYRLHGLRSMSNSARVAVLNT